MRAKTSKIAEPFEVIARRLSLGTSKLPNIGKAVDTEQLKPLLRDAVLQLIEIMHAKKETFDALIRPQLNEKLEKLEAARGRHYEQLLIPLQGIEEIASSAQKQMKKRQVDRNIEDYKDWVKDTMETEDAPFIQVFAAFVAEK